MSKSPIKQVIEDLAMAITHSVQGEYAKNEKFVIEKIKIIQASTRLEEQRKNCDAYDLAEKETFKLIKQKIKKLPKQKTYFDDRPSYFISDINKALK